MEIISCEIENCNCHGIIIDDDQDIVESMSEMLCLKGICVIGKGYNGEEAFQLYKKCNPNFVILDMSMPKYDGAYAIKKIKNLNPNAKIIVLTGHTEYKFQKNDVHAVMYKPYKIKKMLNILKEIC